MTGSIDLSKKIPLELALPISPVRVTSSSETQTLIPIQKAFRKLAQDPLFQRSPLNVSFSLQEPECISWTVAKVGALFDAIYNSNVLTPEDAANIQALSKEVDALENSFKVRTNLSLKEKAYNEKCLGLAKQALTELVSLRHALENSYPIQDRWNEAIGALSDRTNAPLFRGKHS